MNRMFKKLNNVSVNVDILTSKITGFLEIYVLAQTFGAGEITDAYLTALNIQWFLTISAALGTTFIPIYFKIKSSKGQRSK